MRATNTIQRTDVTVQTGEVVLEGNLALPTGDVVGAVVPRGGCPDLAGDALPRVKAPTQLIVGGEDRQVIALNRQASALLHGEHRIDIVPGATHLFEEPGMLEEVARLACSWFTQHLAEQS